MDWIARHRRLALAVICALWVGGVVAALRWPALPFFSAVGRAEQTFEDVLRREGRKTPTREDFVFVGIDQQSLQLSDVVTAEEITGNRAFQLMTERPYPWSREVWAILLDRLYAAGARIVFFDMLFNPPNDGDPVFAEALERHRDRVVLGLNFDEQRGMLIGPNPTLIPSPQEQDPRVGLTNFWPDESDGRVRSAHYLISERQLIGQSPLPSDPLLATLSGRVIPELGREEALPRELRAYPIRFCAADAYPPRPLWEIFDERSWAANFGSGAAFKDKVVVVGASAQVLHDFVATPLGQSTYGPAMHLHALAAALAGEFLTHEPALPSYASLVLAGFLAWALIAFVRRPLISFVALVAMAAAYLFAVRLAYDSSGLILLTVPVLISFVGSGISSLGFEYARERREKLKTRRTLERYVSKNLVREILDNPGGYYSSLRGARKPVTVLFSDLIGFTTLSERADPEELVRQLNEYLSAMVAVVFETDGTLDKFIGDAIMAVWGNVRSAGVAQDAKSATRTALGMRRALKKLNDGWRVEGRMGLGMGIGINHGEALVGNIGSSAPHERLDPTVIGDAVNLASRLEGLTRTYGVDILIGASVADLVRDEFHLRSVARVQVKGKTIPVEILTVLAAHGDEMDPEWLKWIERYEEAIQKFRGRDFAGAKDLLEQFMAVYPSDYLAQTYLDRAREYEANPPDEFWDAAEIFTKK